MSREIFIVIGSLERGGTERHLTYILPLLIKKGWTLTVVCLSPHVPLAPLLQQAGVTVIAPTLRILHLPSVLKIIFRLLHCVWTLIKLYRKHPKAIFHYFLPEAYIIGLLTALLGRHKGLRIMSRRSLNTYQTKRPFLGWLERHLHGFCHIFLANSQRVQKQLMQEGIASHKIKLIYNGIPFHPLKRHLQASLTFMIVANLIPYKGHKDLLQALGLIKDKLPQPWKLWIVGRDGGIQKDLEALCQTLSLTSHVDFLGSREDVEQLWAQCHVGLLTSHEEGFSNAILEAMAMGVPMIVTDVGGNAEAVINEVTGLVVPPHDPKALALALLRLGNDTKRQNSMGLQGQERVRKYFSLESCAQSYHTIYKHHY